MNPLTQIRNTNKATRSEVALGLGGSSSWHARFKHSAYIYVGGLPYELTEGDILAVFAQYGEVVDVYLVRDKKTGKSRGFAFLAYEDQRSTVLAVDNLSGARVAGRIVRVEHVDNYKRKRAEVEGLDEGIGDDESLKPKKVEQIDSGPKSFVDLMQEARSKGLLSRPWEKEKPQLEEGEGRKHTSHKSVIKHRKERDGDGYHEKTFA